MNETSQPKPIPTPPAPVAEAIGMDAHSRKIVLCHMRRVGDAIQKVRTVHTTLVALEKTISPRCRRTCSPPSPARTAPTTASTPRTSPAPSSATDPNCTPPRGTLLRETFFAYRDARKDQTRAANRILSFCCRHGLDVDRSITESRCRDLLAGTATRFGRADLKAIFIEGAQTVLRTGPPMARWAKHLLARGKHWNVVVCALARKLAVLCWHILMGHPAPDRERQPATALKLDRLARSVGQATVRASGYASASEYISSVTFRLYGHLPEPPTPTENLSETA